MGCRNFPISDSPRPLRSSRDQQGTDKLGCSGPAVCGVSWALRHVLRRLQQEFGDLVKPTAVAGVPAGPTITGPRGNGFADLTIRWLAGRPFPIELAIGRAWVLNRPAGGCTQAWIPILLPLLTIVCPLVIRAVGGGRLLPSLTARVSSNQSHRLSEAAIMGRRRNGLTPGLSSIQPPSRPTLRSGEAHADQPVQAGPLILRSAK